MTKSLQFPHIDNEMKVDELLTEKQRKLTAFLLPRSLEWKQKKLPVTYKIPWNRTSPTYAQWNAVQTWLSE